MESFAISGINDQSARKFKKFELKSQYIMYGNSGEGKPIKEKKPGLAVRFQEVILGGLEQFFYNYGKFVAR